MKTASVIASLSRNAGGLFESVRRLHQSLAKLPDVEVTVFGLRDSHTAEDINAWLPVRVFDHPTAGPVQFGYSPALRRSMLAMDFDILHTHGIWMYPSVVTHMWSKRYSRPYVISPHGMLDPWAVRNSAWKKRIARWLYEDVHLRNAACIRALCESEAQAIRAFGLKNPIAIIPNGIDLPDLRSPNSDVQPPPWSARLETGKKVLLYLGRIHPKKGLPNLLRAWAAVARSSSADFCSMSSDWALAIAGWDQGGHEAELKQLATELGIGWVDIRDQPSTINHQLSLLFLGPQFGDAKATCYRNCGGFILPSFSEGLPMVLLEAWAHRKPVLMTPECNLPEGFSGNAAIRIDPNSTSIAGGLEGFFRSSPSVLRTLGANGRTLVAHRFTWPKIAADTKTVYDWVLRIGQKPPFVSTE